MHTGTSPFPSITPVRILSSILLGVFCLFCPHSRFASSPSSECLSGLLHIMEAVAHFSYAASEADELSFHKGEIIKVIEIEDDPNWFTGEIQGRRGYVPENYISLLPHPWFAGRVSRQEAEQRLRWQVCGAFLLRESESAPGEFSVSVSYGDMVEHFRVLEGAGGQYCVWEESFLSLNRLVDFYRTHSIAVDRTVCLRDLLLPSDITSPCQSDPGPLNNPYLPPNPYTTSSSRRQHCRPAPQRDASPGLLETVLGKPRVAQALVDYSPPHAAHLHFLRGDIINLLDCSTGSPSWRGRCRGRVGIFPPEFVQPVYH